MHNVNNILTVNGKTIIVDKHKDENKLKISYTEELDDQELALIHIICQAIRAYTSGKELEFYFDPYKEDRKSEKANDPIVKCEWLRSGNLVCRDADYNKRYLHADTTDQALQRNRVFTCKKTLFAVLPKRRTIKNREGKHLAIP